MSACLVVTLSLSLAPPPEQEQAPEPPPPQPSPPVAFEQLFERTRSEDAPKELGRHEQRVVFLLANGWDAKDAPIPDWTSGKRKTDEWFATQPNADDLGPVGREDLRDVELLAAARLNELVYLAEDFEPSGKPNAWEITPPIDWEFVFDNRERPVYKKVMAVLEKIRRPPQADIDRLSGRIRRGNHYGGAIRAALRTGGMYYAIEDYDKKSARQIASATYKAELSASDFPGYNNELKNLLREEIAAIRGTRRKVHSELRRSRPHFLSMQNAAHVRIGPMSRGRAAGEVAKWIEHRTFVVLTSEGVRELIEEVRQEIDGVETQIEKIPDLLVRAPDVEKLNDLIEKQVDERMQEHDRRMQVLEAKLEALTSGAASAEDADER